MNGTTKRASTQKDINETIRVHSSTLDSLRTGTVHPNTTITLCRGRSADASKCMRKTCRKPGVEWRCLAHQFAPFDQWSGQCPDTRNLKDTESMRRRQ